MNMITMLLLLVGFLVVTNLITLKRCLDMKARLDLLVRLSAMQDTLALEKEEQLQNSIHRLESTKSPSLSTRDRPRVH